MSCKRIRVAEWNARSLTADKMWKLLAIILKEKIDILFKLGRTYVNKKQGKIQPDNIEEMRNNAEVVETVTIKEDWVEDLQAWTQNKLRGFRRAGPTAQPTHRTHSQAAKSHRISPSLPWEVVARLSVLPAIHSGPAVTLSSPTFWPPTCGEVVLS